MIPGRVLLGAHVSGRAAAAVLHVLEERRMDVVASTWRRSAAAERRPDLAVDSAALDRFMAELREAVLQWHEIEGASASGSAEVVAAEVARPSKGVGDLLTTAQAAAVLRVSERRVRQLRADGSLAASWVGGQWLVERASVAELRARRELRAS